MARVDLGGAIVAVALLSCVPRATTPSKAVEGAAGQNLSHCAALEDVLKKEGLECLALPGLIDVGIFGPREYPNESTLDAGFGHAIPAGVIGKARPGGTHTHYIASTQTARAHLGLSLTQFFKWLPDTKLTASRDDALEATATLTNLTLQPIQNLPEEIRPIVDSQAVDARTQTVREMLRKLCRTNTVVSSLTLSAETSVTISSRDHAELSADLGWANVAGFTTDLTHARDGKVTLHSKSPIVFAAQLRNSEPWVHELCSDGPCGRQGQRCCFDATCSAGSVCDAGICAPRAIPTLVGAKVTWTTTGDDKDWDTQPEVTLFDQRGRKVAHVACCNAARDSDIWSRPRAETRDMTLLVQGVNLRDLAAGHLEATRHPVGSDDWDYTATVQLFFSEGPPVSYSCSGRNSCGQRWPMQ